MNFILGEGIVPIRLIRSSILYGLRQPIWRLTKGGQVLSCSTSPGLGIWWTKYIKWSSQKAIR